MEALMEAMALLLMLVCLYGVFDSSDAQLKWSTSYSMKAVLTVPAANLTEPYQVWLNGETGKSRVDFYHGMDKLYREWDDINKKYKYYKVYPETSEQFSVKDVCRQVSADATETRMYVLNTYLPVKNFKFIQKEHVSNVDAQKWRYEYTAKLEQSVTAKVSYTMWVTFKKTAQGQIPVPLRYIYEMKADGKVLDYFRHDYSYFDEVKPMNSDVMKPLGIQCSLLKEFPAHEPVDPLADFIEPLIEHSRVTKAFDTFKMKHKKKYTNELEHFKKMNIFKDNLRFINSFNRQRRTFTLAMNKFADLTESEAYVLLGTMQTRREIENYEASDFEDDDDDDDVIRGNNVNVNFDWRDYGAVTPVKDQTSLCGACYAFTTAAAVESGAYISRGCKHLDEISEQAIVDCSWGSAHIGNLGCTGGTYEYSLHWIKKHGAALKSEYGPYLAMEGRCHFKNMTKIIMINGYKQLPKKKGAIKETLRETGPLLAAINSNLKSFLFYSRGVFNDPICSSDPDMRSHGVTLTGYGKDGDQEYWLIKNSFGTSWGEKGYMRLATKNNVCGLKNFIHSVNFKTSKVENCKVL